MKIAIISPFLPYSTVKHAGGYFIYCLIKYLSQKHKVHLIVRVNDNDGEESYINEVKEICEAVHIFRFKKPSSQNIFSTFKIIISYFRLQIFANKIIKKEKFDIIDVEYTETAILITKIKNTPLLVDMIDVISKPAFRTYLSSENIFKKIINYFIWQAKKIIENYVAEKADCSFTLSKIDKMFLSENNPDVKIVDTGLSAKPYLFAINSAISNKDKNMLLFVGAMNRGFNQEAVEFFIEKVLPILLPKYPDIKFYVVGANPPEKLKEIARKNKSVVVTDFVEDLTPYYEKAYIFVSPILVGGGIISKNIDAMAAGVPVITTPFGNEGIEAKNGEEIFETQTPEEFAEIIIKLREDEKLWRTISDNSRKYASNNFTEEIIFKKYEETFLKYANQ